ncbi:NfeD family protein [Endozoicomonas numazuensis]|uniref:Membrane protein n=1 Tax=Endozoicomonas numazuensis TaxID=1137799 RepID=A0A081NH12_9GAMM|nr:NfeD family protein [Endozoicomonas numazuensis]KEQ17735.1 membrane protein [Endozoicomonas numazuensis]
MDFLNTLQPWHWLIVAFLCLGLEALGAGGFLLGSAAAAFLLAAVLWLLPETGWAWQLVWFAVGSLIFTVAYWKFFRGVNEKSDYPQLNQRAAQLIGRVVVLENDLPGGQGKIQIGDTLWSVKAVGHLEKGCPVIITGAEGMTLLIDRHS